MGRGSGNAPFAVCKPPLNYTEEEEHEEEVGEEEEEAAFERPTATCR